MATKINMASVYAAEIEENAWELVFVDEDGNEHPAGEVEGVCWPWTETQHDPFVMNEMVHDAVSEFGVSYFPNLNGGPSLLPEPTYTHDGSYSRETPDGKFRLDIVAYEDRYAIEGRGPYGALVEARDHAHRSEHLAKLALDEMAETFDSFADALDEENA